MLKESDKIKYLQHIKNKWLNGLNISNNKIDASFFHNKMKITEDKTILDIYYFDNKEIFYILYELNNFWLISENLKHYDLDLNKRFEITAEWEYFLLQNKKILNKIELWSKDYPFLSALFIWFVWWIGATILNILIK